VLHTCAPRLGLSQGLTSLWALATAVIICGCAATEQKPVAKPILPVVGAGATFPYPLYRAWFSEFERREQVRMDYFAVGSQEGVRLLEHGDADFAATDRPSVASANRGRAACDRIVVPMVSGPLSVVYHLPSTNGDVPLRLDAGVTADIFAGRITRWNAGQIRALNPQRSLPDLRIVVVHRASGSGTSRAFANYLATSGRWSKDGADDTSEVRWPVGIAAEGNAGVALEVKVREGAIGYVELSYARQNRLDVAALRVASGALAAPGDRAEPYPATGVTWLVIDPARVAAPVARALVHFIEWAQTDGAAQATALEYTLPAPDSIAFYHAMLDRVPFESCGATRSGSAARGRGRALER